MRSAFVILFLLAAGKSFAQDDPFANIPLTGKTIKAFIPDHYSMLRDTMYYGDLNQDGLEDAVLVLYSTFEDSPENHGDEMPDRLLLILFKTANGYTLAGKSSKAVLCYQCGGVFGDPFDGVSISEKGVLQISHYGGSSERWAFQEKFRYQNGSFYLIGSSSDIYSIAKDCGDNSIGEADHIHHDNNWITGDEEILEKGDNCRITKNIKHKIKKKPLVSLNRYEGPQGS